MISFIIGCVALALCIAIGFFFLQLGFMILAMLYAGVAAMVEAIYNWLTNNR